MKVCFSILLCLICINFIYSEDYSSYSMQLINTVKAGKKEGLIGWERSIAGGNTGPTTFNISYNNEIYIPDRVNYRINVYDLNFNYIRTIYEKIEIKAHFSHYLKVDKQNNIYYVSRSSGLIKLDPKGNRIYLVKPELLSKHVFYYSNFFPINNSLIIYNNKNEIQYIDSKGNIQSTEKALALLNGLSAKSQPVQSKSMNSNTINNKQQAFDKLREEKKYILLEDNFFNTQIYDHQKYYKKIESAKPRKRPEAPGGGSKSMFSKKKFNINIDEYGISFIGYDNEHNSYWGAGKDIKDGIRTLIIIIMDKYGEILDAFPFGQYKNDKPQYDLYPATNALLAVSPKGDVYFLTGNSEKYSLYKVERKW